MKKEFEIKTEHRGLTFRYKGAGLKRVDNIDIKSEHLGKYYFNFSEVCDPSWPFDENGVRLRPYPPPLFYQYLPVAIAEYALDQHRIYLETKEDKYKLSFLKNAKWFLNNQRVIDGKYGMWLCNSSWQSKYNVIYPCPDAMSQGYGISLLLRAYQMTEEEAYREAAHLALRSYECDVVNGGIRNRFKGHVFYEEAPSIPPSCILNGFIFSLLGPYDLYRVEGDMKAKEIFETGIETLEKCLTYYDIGYWSLYNLQYNKYLASKYYHNIHIIQLLLLYEITNSKIFYNYAEKWNAYRNNISCLFRYYRDFFYYRYKYKLKRIAFLLSSC